MVDTSVVLWGHAGIDTLYASADLMWREHMARLAAFHCLAPDLLGFGRSNGLPWVSRSVTADLVAELVETRVPARRYTWSASRGAALSHTRCWTATRIRSTGPSSTAPGS